MRKLTYDATVDMARPSGVSDGVIRAKAVKIFDELYLQWEPYEKTGLPITRGALLNDNLLFWDALIALFLVFHHFPDLLFCHSLKRTHLCTLEVY